MRDRGEGVVADRGWLPTATGAPDGIGDLRPVRMGAAVKDLRGQHRIEEALADRDGQSGRVQEAEIKAQVVADDRRRAGRQERRQGARSTVAGSIR